MPCTLTYHLQNNRIKKIIYNNFQLLSNDSKAKRIFDPSPLMAFQRDKRIRDSLIRTQLQSSDSISTLAITPSAKHTPTSIPQIQSPTEAKPSQPKPPLLARLSALFIVPHAPNATCCILEQFHTKQITNLENTCTTLGTRSTLTNNTKKTLTVTFQDASFQPTIQLMT